MSWHSITEGEIGRLQEAIVSIVEHRSSYGAESPDWDRVLDEIEASEDGLDLGSDMNDPVVKAILRRARRVYRELREANE